MISRSEMAITSNCFTTDALRVADAIPSGAYSYRGTFPLQSQLAWVKMATVEHAKTPCLYTQQADNERGTVAFLARHPPSLQPVPALGERI